jgi:hypothetical protein
VYDAAAERVVFLDWDRALVAGEGVGLQSFDLGFLQGSAAWPDRDHVLLIGDGEHVVFVRSGERRLTPRHDGSCPKICPELGDSDALQPRLTPTPKLA